MIGGPGGPFEQRGDKIFSSSSHVYPKYEVDGISVYELNWFGTRKSIFPDHTIIGDNMIPSKLSFFGEKKKDDDCFVATVVYGSASAPELDVLRDFRDNVLIKNELGKKVVDLYYGGFGEGAANFIKKHIPFVVPTIKNALDHIVRNYDKRSK